jgi:hypothetical protein
MAGEVYSEWKFPHVVEKQVSVKILDARLVSGEMPEGVEPMELFNEIADWAFHKAKDFGEKAGSLRETFTQDDSLIEFDEPADFSIEVTIF